MSDSFDPKEVASAVSGGELTDARLPSQSGYAGPPQWPRYYQTSPRSARQGTFVYSVALGIAIAVFLTLATSPAKAIVGGFAPLALWLLWMTFAEVRRGVRWSKAKVQMGRDTRRHTRSLQVPVVKASRPKRNVKADYLKWIGKASALLATAEAVFYSSKHRRNKAVSVALKLQGQKPYLLAPGSTGIDSPNLDCSGLIQTAYGEAGITLPRTAQGQFNAGPQPESLQPTAAKGPLATVVSQLQPGDLVFFGDPKNPTTGVDHVGMIVSTNPPTWISESSEAGNVTVKPFGPQSQSTWIGTTRPSTSPGPNTSR
jgi:cell wall-associated NlpC family hydrolase